jgi:hypothetical protein
MTFNDWWQTLTPAEHKTIGKNNARFVWRMAHQICAKLCVNEVVGSEALAAFKIQLAKKMRERGDT